MAERPKLISNSPDHLLLKTLVVFGVFCHCLVLILVKGSARADHDLGEKPPNLGNFCWELPHTEWSWGPVEKQ